MVCFFDGFSGVFCKVLVQCNCCADIEYKMSIFCFLPCDKANGPGCQRRELSKSQMGPLFKSILLHCALFEVS